MKKNKTKKKVEGRVETIHEGNQKYTMNECLKKK